MTSLEETSLVSVEDKNKIRNYINNLPPRAFILSHWVWQDAKVKRNYTTGNEMNRIINELYPDLDSAGITRLGEFIFWKNHQPVSRYGVIKPRPLDILLAIEKDVGLYSWSALYRFGLTTQVAPKPLVTIPRPVERLETLLEPEWFEYMKHGLHIETKRVNGGEHGNTLVNLSFVNCFEEMTFCLAERPGYSGKQNTSHKALVNALENLILNKTKGFDLEVVKNIMSYQPKENQIRFAQVLASVRV